MHVRRTIREAVAAVLKAALITGVRVYENRLYPVAESDLPCLLIITGGDQSGNIDLTQNPLQQRNVRVQIRAIVKMTKDLDDAMEALCTQIETAIAAATFPFKVEKRYIGTEHQESAIGNQPVGQSTLFYDFTVMTRENNPETMV